MPPFIRTVPAASVRARPHPVLRLAGLLALTLAGITCRDGNPLAPGMPVRASLAVAPSFERPALQRAGATAGAFGALKTVHGALVAAGGGAPYQASANFVGDTARLVFDVAFAGPSQRYTLVLAATDSGGDTLFRSTGDIVAQPGVNVPLAPLLRYVAPDTAVRFLAVSVADTLLVIGDSLGVSAAGYDAARQAVSPVRVAWTLHDTSGATVSARTGSTARLFGGRADDDVWVVATTFNGTSDSVRIRARIPTASVQLSADTVRMYEGGVASVTAWALDAKGTPLEREVSWLATDPTVASVGVAPQLVSASAPASASYAQVRAHLAGTTRVVANSGGKADTVVVVVMPGADSVPPNIVRTVLSPKSVELRAIGATAQLSAASYAADSSLVAGQYSWSVPAGSSVGVDSLGRVTALSPGSSWVSVTERGGTTDSALVSVSQVAWSVTVDPPSVSVDALGATVTYRASVADSLGSNIPSPPLAWSVDVPAIAQVDVTGGDSAVVRSLASGVTKIVASSGAATGSAELVVSQAAKSATLRPPTTTLGLGGRGTLIPTLLDGNGGAMPFAWNEVEWVDETKNGVIAIDSVGEVLATAFGTTTVHALVRGIPTGPVTVTVSDAAPATLTFSLDTLTVMDSAKVAVYLSATSPTPVTVVLSDSAGLVKPSADTLVFDNTTRMDVLLTRAADGITTLVASDAGKAYAPATVKLGVGKPLPPDRSPAPPPQGGLVAPTRER